jgi:hypothetical protein
MTRMPGFWTWLCRDWLALPEHVAWAWWQALRKSPWARCREFREAVLRYGLCAYPAQSASRAQLTVLMEPGTLMQITAELVTQGLLLRRDAGLIDQAVLDRLDARGEWKEKRSTP